MSIRVVEESEKLQCPYNISHHILRSRFQVHLVRCRKSYPHAEVVICPFNITHRVNKQELDWHVTNCPERLSFEKFKTSEVPVDGLSSTINKSFCGDISRRSMMTETTELVSSENWDDEPDVPGYNPIKYVEQAKVLRLPVGMPPSQRAAFREAERRRLNAMSKND